MKQNKLFMAHIIAFFTAIIWGTTFISTKVLLGDFTPLEILLYRFVIGYIVLSIIKPKPLSFQGWKKEVWFFLAGISGVTVYFLCENFALTYTLASNVSIIVSLAPMFTAVMVFLFLKQEKLGKNFFMGFLVAITGIILINYNGREVLHLNPMGDFLAIGAAFVWAVYSVILKAQIPTGKDALLCTRRIFFYGIITMIPIGMILGVSFEPSKFLQPLAIGNFLYLGIFATALGYLLWNIAVDILGTLKASVYIYVIPVITIIASVIFLKEPLTPVVMVGALLAVAGLFISQRK